ncbi:MAG: maleylpyruvate isomerase family mycothiol-dependent enzyme [Jatrophihabitans sp.]
MTERRLRSDSARTEPIAALQALRASTADLVRGLSARQWSDDEIHAASLCDGWTRAHVLSHLARNADGIAATLSGALRGEIVQRYPDGWDARDADIEGGSTRPTTEIAADVVASADRLDRVLAAVAEANAWDAPTDQNLVAGDWPPRRLLEVEIHRVDLAGEYTPDRWPPLLVADLLPVVAATLPKRVQGAVRVRIDTEGSIVPDHPTTEWTAGEGEPTEVRGPDWAILAWLVGRPTVVEAALTAAPALAPWG